MTNTEEVHRSERYFAEFKVWKFVEFDKKYEASTYTAEETQSENCPVKVRKALQYNYKPNNVFAVTRKI